MLLLLFLGAGPVFGRGFILRDLHAVLLRQVFHSLDKGHAGVVHQKADGVAVFAAAKAVVELFGRADRKRRRFFAMERAQPHEIGAPFFELHVAAHNLHHVRAGEEFLEKALRDGHKVIVGTQSPSTTPSRRGSAPPK